MAESARQSDTRSILRRAPPVGELLRQWRRRRGLSQLDLACAADISTRHVSFLETGRSLPSRSMVIHLAERLDIPLRERNGLLVAAGYAPVYPEHGLDDPALRAAREAVDLVLAGHEPYPALAIDRHWTLVAANRAVGPLLAGAASDLLRPPVNVLRLSLHPEGLAPRIENFGQWRGHVLTRLARQVDVSGDPVLTSLHAELKALPVPGSSGLEANPDAGMAGGHADVVVPLRLRTDAGLLSFFSTTTVFGTAVDVTLSELAIEAFFPADGPTAEALRSALAP
ncbi:transcriptional regulator with XRE-family HTH domain [Skermanella aerolata]|uniref:Transcriptional regulator n=1 Tax=Skermanella aerolata TaxID=393310 RepID=A0A512DV31_9PROT|nr:helix-turn-helix transcriptional regulator [Skermanella aerolata]KJB94804.1 XRE family transcriptional regulator [Skermanella aerolata KACC 11604]GEO40333.1 transcriptional regulator [Skermanella aerolata]